MKKLFLSLALVVSASVFATVNLEVTTRLNDESNTKNFTLDTQNNNCILEHSCGVHTTITLEKETPEGAEFSVDMTMKSDTEESTISKSTIRVAYGEKASLKCTSDKVDAEFSLVANPVAVVAQ